MHGLRLKLERGPKFRDKRNMCITGRASSVHVSILGEYTKGTWFNRTSTRNIRMARLGKIPARFICRKKMHAPNGQEEQCCGPATRAWQWTSRAAEPDPQRDSQTCQPVLARSKSMIDRRTVCRAGRVENEIRVRTNGIQAIEPRECLQWILFLSRYCKGAERSSSVVTPERHPRDAV